MQQPIQLWWLDPTLLNDSQWLHQLQQQLSSDEQARLARYKHVQSRHNALIARGLLRCMLSHYYPDLAPNQWQFQYGPQGKPALHRDMPHHCEFNLSHTQGYIICALHPDTPVGVDVESQQRRGNHLLKIAQHYFAPAEVALLQNTPEAKQAALFFQIWTLKEAFVKASGAGLTVPLSDFWFEDPAHPNIQFADQVKELPRHWHFHQFQHNQFQLALAQYGEYRCEYQLQSAQWPAL